MILTFLLRRRSALKALGSVIDEALRREHRCHLVVREEAKEPFRPGDFERWRGIVYRGIALRGTVIGVATDAYCDIGVSHWFDNILTPGNKQAQTVCYLSQWHKDLHMSVNPAGRWWIEGQPIVGWTMADHRALLVPQYSEWHVLFTMKRRVPEPWRKSIRGRLWYFEKVYGAWHAAKEAGLPLIVKTRAKHGDPWWLRRHHVVEEPSMYPSASLQVLNQASQATHFMSGAHAEAVLMNVPVLNHWVPQPHLDRLPGQKEIYNALVLKPPVTRSEYMTKFFTYDDTHAASRVMDVAERSKQ